MDVSVVAKKSGNQLSASSILLWRFAQALVWLIGFGIMFCLWFFPSLGLLLFWNILIPVAPLLLVVATGLWRNVCPLATTNLLPRHLGLSKRKIMTSTQLGKWNLASVILLFMIVPLRHPIFNNNGHATALLIILMAIIGISVGLVYEWKSAWCSGLCPIHPVEKMYGQNTLSSIPNAHCSQCMNCVIPCPDATPNINPTASSKTIYHKINGNLMVGGLPGFIWGWFQVPDKTDGMHLNSILQAYEWPLIGLVVSLSLYIIISKLTKRNSERLLISIFAAAAVSFYYWHRIPELFGFGPFDKDGLLIDLSHQISAWIFTSISIAFTIFFWYWLVIRKQNKKSWIIRPEFGKRISSVNPNPLAKQNLHAK